MSINMNKPVDEFIAECDGTLTALGKELKKSEGGGADPALTLIGITTDVHAAITLRLLKEQAATNDLLQQLITLQREQNKWVKTFYKQGGR